MRRLSIIQFILAMIAVPVAAQNNPYAIDDECYEYFLLAESLVSDTSSEAFEYANDALLKRAMEVGDEKARTLYYVGKLKRESRLSRILDDREAANARMDFQLKETTNIALETGYIQYFYYAYSLCQNYYVNTQQEVRALTLLQEMLDVATRRGDEYGIWQSHGYMAAMYQLQNDLLNARKHLRMAIDIFDSSEDKTLRRQTVSRQLSDLADTYIVGSDSARFYYLRSEEAAKTHYDTLRVTYYKAQLAALDQRIQEYHKYRDNCLADYAFENQVNKGVGFFSDVDAILEGAPRDTVIARTIRLESRQQLLFLRYLAISCKREDVVPWMGTRIILTFSADISRLNDAKMEEMSAAIHHRQATMDLDRQKSINLKLWIALGVLAAALLAAIAALLYEKKNKKQ